MGDMTMMGGAIDLLPWWMRLIWTALFAWVAASHLSHVILMRGQPRWWHTTHLLMALGMLYMFAAWQTPPVSFDVFAAGYVFAAGTIASFILLSGLRRDPVNLLWFLQLIGMCAMAYMFTLMDLTMQGHDLMALTLGLAAFYVLEAAGWSRRLFAEVDERRLSWIPKSVPFGRRHAVCASSLCGRVPVDLALSGAVMSLGMSYMFLAMDPRTLDWLDEALRADATEQTWYALAGLFMVFLLVLPWPRHRLAGAASGAVAAAPTSAAAIATSPGRVTGVVNGGTGATDARPLAGSRVLLLDSAGAVRGQTITGWDGSYQFVGLAPGAYTLLVTGYGPQTETIQLDAGATFDASVTLGPGSRAVPANGGAGGARL